MVHASGAGALPEEAGAVAVSVVVFVFCALVPGITTEAKRTMSLYLKIIIGFLK
jgi:hypothetical protein